MNCHIGREIELKMQRRVKGLRRFIRHYLRDKNDYHYEIEVIKLSNEIATLVEQRGCHELEVNGVIFDINSHRLVVIDGNRRGIFWL